VCFATLAVFANLQRVYPSTDQALAHEASPVFRGNWTATAGSQVFRGTWSAQTSAHNPKSAVGSWTVLNDAGEIFLQGTWSASKARPGWQGTWTAKTSSGRSFSGTWTSDLQDLSAKTFEEMLERTKLAEVAGSWKSGPQHGNWWLKH